MLRMSARRLRKVLSGALLSLVMLLFADTAQAVDASDRYRSPRNPERKIRQATTLIVLHTTEAPARSSLNKVSDRGECHYCVTEEGQVYRIVDRDREAFHAGRSMWNGREDVDKFSVGIECVGYHNKAMPTVQIAAIRDLVKELQSMYRIPDERVVAHSHVAYGAPNKWQRRRHRGRKRCGMLFAMASVRLMLNLRTRPAYDPDTRAGRLSIGDDYLNNVLYGRIDTMVGAYGRPAKAAIVQKPTATAPVPRPKALKTASPPPRVTTVAKARPVKAPPPAPSPQPPTPAPPAVKPREEGAAADDENEPIPVITDPKSIAQLRLCGYQVIGTVTKERSALRIAGSKWNAPDTYYEIRGRVTPGDKINAAHMEKGMSVWRKK